MIPEVSFLDVDEGYDWIGGAQAGRAPATPLPNHLLLDFSGHSPQVALSQNWQHIAMAPVSTGPQHKGHEIQVAFLIGEGTRPARGPTRARSTPAIPGSTFTVRTRGSPGGTPPGTTVMFA